MDPSSTSRDRDTAPPRVLSALLAAIVLLQALWVPFHLATERHLSAAEAVTLSLRSGTTTDDGGAGDEDVHSELDHKLAQDRRDAAADDQDLEDGSDLPPAMLLPPNTPFLVFCDDGMCWAARPETGPPRPQRPRLRPSPRAPPRA